MRSFRDTVNLARGHDHQSLLDHVMSAALARVVSKDLVSSQEFGGKYRTAAHFAHAHRESKAVISRLQRPAWT